MPDEHDSPGTGRRSDSPARPRTGRRRSMEDQGGISVSDVVARTTGARPLPPREQQDRADQPGRRVRTAEPPAPPAPARATQPPRAPRPAQAPAENPVPTDVTRQSRPPRPRQPRRTTAAAPLPEAPPQRRPSAAAPGSQQTSAPQPPRRPRRPAPDGAAPQRPQPGAADPDAPTQKRPPVTGVGSAPPRAALDPMTMTDEMEAIDEATQVRRKIDNTLARFSAAHDEMEAEEAKRRERRDRLTPASLLESTRTALQRVVAPVPSEELEVDAAEQAAQTRLQEKKQRKFDRSVRFGRIAAAVVAGLVFLGIGGAWGAQTYFDAKFTQVSALDENSADIQDADAQANDENFLMVGSDTRDGASAEEGVGTADSNPGARSDTVMVAHIPADRKRVVVTSFPRDLEIDRPDCQRWDPAQNKTTDQVSPRQKIAKLNTAYAVGGPACVTKVIQQITGLRINHFVGIDFNGFKEMVDAVHGVTVHTDKPIDDEILGKVLMQTGDVTISGDQALNFVRARHVKADVAKSDYDRIKRQQEFIGALLKKVMSSDVVLDPGKLSDFINAFAKATFGDNLGVKQMMTLAQSMKGLDPSKITFLTVPTVGIANGRGNEVLVRSKTKALFDALRNNTPLPDPNAPVPVSEQAPPTSTSKSSSKSSSSGKTSTSRKPGTTG
ncbi:LCP family protein [Amycolatopsis sp. NPDC051128]|uniref:LCP family protein n=1 Tax=Amycolatopsis sp. NPDC051128 TaxID=3155412 RepID=UPI003445DA25